MTSDQHPDEPQDSASVTITRPGWGGWELHPVTLTLEYETSTGTFFILDLGECCNAAEVLERISQVVAGPWARPETLAGMIHALDDVLHLHVNLCTYGAAKEITRDQIRELVEQMVQGKR
jgi:hypothetical protein